MYLSINKNMRANEITDYYYFGYGHLTLSKETRHLARDAEYVGIGRLNDWQLVIRNFCDIENKQGQHVLGTVWRVTLNDLKRMDQHEAVPEHYERLPLEVEVDGKTVTAMVYIMTPEYRVKHGPTEKYIRQITTGYKEHGLPLEQIKQAMAVGSAESKKITDKQDLAEEILDEFTAYHGTYRPTLARFKPLSHFGTERAAAERLQHVKDTNPALADKPGYIYQLDLGITNPGRVKDYVNLTDPGPGSMKKIAAWSKDLLKNPNIVGYTGKNPIDGKTDTGVNILKHFITLANSGYWADYYPYTKFIAMWINFLLSAGIDGLVYNNQVEHNRSTSFITFNPDQIKIVGKPKIIK